MNSTITMNRPREGLGRFLLEELKPKGPIITPFNVISGAIILTGLVVLFFRFVSGLGAVTNLTQETPWGLWKGFNVVCGVALAGGAYVITFVVYVMKMDKYHSIVRATVLSGLLAYTFYAGTLLLELGRPWFALNPYIGNGFGFSSVLFLICWHFLLYMVAEFIEFSPVVAEWLNMERARKVLKSLTLATVVFGITLSILHQSGLGALYLMARWKIHPLWYSEFIPILFFVSSIYAGLCVIIMEGTINRRIYRRLFPRTSEAEFREIVFGLSKGAALTMFVYYFLKALLFVHDKQWDLLGDGWGYWFLLEVLGFVLVPAVMFAFGFKHRSLKIIKTAAVMGIIGILLNRLNISVIAFNWYLGSSHYYPAWQEYVVAASVILAELWVLRWIVLRMPVFGPRRATQH